MRPPRWNTAAGPARAGQPWETSVRASLRARVAVCVHRVVFQATEEEAISSRTMGSCLVGCLARVRVVLAFLGEKKEKKKPNGRREVHKEHLDRRFMVHDRATWHIFSI